MSHEIERIIIECAENKIHIPDLWINGDTIIYFLYLEDEIVYVGQTGNLDVRIRSHFYDKIHPKTFNSYGYINFSGINHVYNTPNDAEADFICKFCPKYNRSIPSNNLWVNLNKLSKLIYKAGGNCKKVRYLVKKHNRLRITILRINDKKYNYYNILNLLQHEIINPIQYKRITGIGFKENIEL